MTQEKRLLFLKNVRGLWGEASFIFAVVLEMEALSRTHSPAISRCNQYILGISFHNSL